MRRLNTALNQGLDLTVSDGKEILVQLYTYAGFPRILASALFMAVLASRRKRGLQDGAGRASGPIPTDLLALGRPRFSRRTRPTPRMANGAS
jgi:hypothetical protein